MQQFLKAETIFFHHIIFNPEKCRCELLINERDNNCSPDVLQRAKESLGITSLDDEIDLTSTVQQEDLHAVATSTKSFLGQVWSREIVEQIYKGVVCARTLRNLSDSPKRSQMLECSAGFQPGRSFSVPRESLSEFDDHSHKVGQSFHTIVTQREVSQPSSAMTAQQIESKKRSQAHERAASLQGLMSVYKTTASTTVAASATNEAMLWLTSTTRTRVTDLKHSNGGKTNSSADASAPSAGILSSTTAEIKSSKVTAMSMKDLIAKHSQSVQATKTPDVQEALAKVMPQSAPESRKRPRAPAKPVTSSARKARTLAPGSGRKTLFDFFQKQT